MACGGRVEGVATSCDDCRDATTGSGGDATATDAPGTHADRSTDATDSAAAHVGAFLAVAAVASAYGLFETLRFALSVTPT